ncbi:MAG: UDP-N-acetylmuramate--L-alanine ligase, partial [Chloroflexota bacterium]
MPHLRHGQHIHLVGIGGAGLSAIARVLLGQGYRVSGSDRTLNTLTEALAKDGAHIDPTHDAANVIGADALIVSSAVQVDQVEIAAAQAEGIPVYKRSDIMADLMLGKQVIAVAGTAGKTTTSAMIAHILIETGKDPSYIVGGVLSTTGQNAGVGAGDVFVVEADEYDNMFLGLRPNIAVVTNVEWDHPDFFKTPDDTQRAFEQFVALLPDEGWLIACADDPGAWRLAEQRMAHSLQAFPYGFDEMRAVLRAVDPQAEHDRYRFGMRMIDSDSPEALQVRLNLPGRHNALNAMAALIASYFAGVDLNEAVAALATFKGTGRRFELKGEVDGVAVIDDYAHHPTKIRATLEAARGRYPDRQIWAVWQPHTYSRTQALMDDYLDAFEDADHILITDIYAAREQPIPGVSAAEIAERMQHPDARFTGTFEATIALLDAEVQAPAAVIVMSAGDAPKIGA